MQRVLNYKRLKLTLDFKTSETLILDTRDLSIPSTSTTADLSAVLLTGTERTPWTQNCHPLQDAHAIYDIITLAGDIDRQYVQAQARNPEMEDLLDSWDEHQEEAKRECYCLLLPVVPVGSSPIEQVAFGSSALATSCASRGTSHRH